MTKKLNQLFNLPENQTLTAEQTDIFLEDQKETLTQIDLAIDKIDNALPLVKDLEASDKELDDLAELAKDKFHDLMDLGMNVESKFSGPIFQTAGVLLGHAITAKQAKLDKKLRMVDLQLKKMRLDHQIKTTDGAPSIEGEGMVIDRNTLLNRILNKPQ
ncbi:MAG: Klebsiella phage vB KleM RaK2 [Bacteroidota bacterium]|jgi:hypothetical protein